MKSTINAVEAAASAVVTSIPKKQYGNPIEYAKTLKSFLNFTKFFGHKYEGVSVSSNVIRLHSSVTVIMLMVAIMFVSSRQYFGNPIECFGGTSSLPPNMIEHYCWLEASFSLHETNEMKKNSQFYPGVVSNTENTKTVYHKYYQWVYLMLLIQCCLFYMPSYIWKTNECKRLQRMLIELKHKRLSEYSQYDSQRLLQDFADSLFVGKDYYFKYLWCKLLCFVHIVCEIWFTNIFLSNQFYFLGIKWLKYAHSNMTRDSDPLIRIFPRFTKCSFHTYGFSGTIETRDALCFLPLNIVHEKVYTVMWFWFVFLLLLTLLSVIETCFETIFSCCRYLKLKFHAPSTNLKILRRLSNNVGYFFVLQLVAKNLKPSYFREIIEQLILKEYFDYKCVPSHDKKSQVFRTVFEKYKKHEI